MMQARSHSSAAVRSHLVVWGALLLLIAQVAIADLVDKRVMLDDIELQATFNRPGLRGDSSSRLEDRLVQLVAMAIPGSRIYVSMYTFRRERMAQALLDADSRGVVVSVVVDDKSLGSEPLQNCGGECVTICWRACHGFHINHNKFLLFSHLDDGSQWVVAQSSANFTDGQLHHYNDLVVIKNDGTLFRAFEDYFYDLRHGVRSPLYFRRQRGESPVRAYFFPRLIGPDPVVRMLEKVHCEPDSVIRLAHSRFESFRNRVARRLSELADDGCDIHIILRDEPAKRSPGSLVVDSLDEHLTVLPYAGEEARNNAIHTKLMLISAPYGDSRRHRHFVITGSHNLSVTSLRLNDEAMLRIDNEALFEAYLAFWEDIRDAHRAGAFSDGYHGG